MKRQPGWGTVRTIIVVLPLLLAAAGSATDFMATRDAVAGRVRATSSLLATYVGTALEQAATSSFLLADFLARNDLPSQPRAIVEAELLADDLLQENFSVSAILAVGRNGEIIVDSRIEAAGWPPGTARDLLALHRTIAPSENPVVSPPYIPDATEERQFNVSISVRDSYGAPHYVVASTVLSRSLIDRVRTASPYRDFTVTLFDRSGNVLARQPSIGTNLTPLGLDRLPAIEAIEPARGHLTYVGRLKFSPRLRVIDVTVVGGFPVFVAYSAAYWEAFSGWLQRSIVVVVTAIAASALLYLALGQLMATSRRELEAERSLREAIDRERKAEIVAIQSQDREVIARLAGGVGHEFNNLMAGILGIGETLIRHPVAAEQAGRFGRSLSQAAERGGRLAHALMIYAGRGFLDFKVVDLQDVVTSAVEAFRTTLRPEITIALRLPDGPLHVRIDPDKLAIAIGHLLMNAVDALPDRSGSIDVSLETGRALPAALARQDGDRNVAAISVVDDGSGMTPEILARARDPFFTTRDVGFGTGLGLSMVDGLVTASGGHLEIESHPGEGTRVTMWLRLADGDGAPIPEPSAAAHG